MKPSDSPWTRAGSAAITSKAFTPFSSAATIRADHWPARTDGSPRRAREMAEITAPACPSDR